MTYQAPDLEVATIFDPVAALGVGGAYVGRVAYPLGGNRILTIGHPVGEFDGLFRASLGATIWEVDPDALTPTVVDSRLIFDSPGTYWYIGGSTLREFFWVRPAALTVGFYIPQSEGQSTTPLNRAIFGRVSWSPALDEIAFANCTEMSTTGGGDGNDHGLVLGLAADGVTINAFGWFDTPGSINVKRMYQTNTMNLSSGAAGVWSTPVNTTTLVGLGDVGGHSFGLDRGAYDAFSGAVVQTSAPNTEYPLTIDLSSSFSSSAGPPALNGSAMAGRVVLIDAVHDRFGTDGPAGAPMYVAFQGGEYVSPENLALDDIDGDLDDDLHYPPWDDYMPDGFVPDLTWRPRSELGEVAQVRLESVPGVGSRYFWRFLDFDSSFRALVASRGISANPWPYPNRIADDGSIRLSFSTSGGVDRLVVWAGPPPEGEEDCVCVVELGVLGAAVRTFQATLSRSVDGTRLYGRGQRDVETDTANVWGVYAWRVPSLIYDGKVVDLQAGLAPGVSPTGPGGYSQAFVGPPREGPDGRIYQWHHPQSANFDRTLQLLAVDPADDSRTIIGTWSTDTAGDTFRPGGLPTELTGHLFHPDTGKLYVTVRESYLPDGFFGTVTRLWRVWEIDVATGVRTILHSFDPGTYTFGSEPFSPVYGFRLITDDGAMWEPLQDTGGGVPENQRTKYRRWLTNGTFTESDELAGQRLYNTLGQLTSNLSVTFILPSGSDSIMYGRELANDVVTGYRMGPDMVEVDDGCGAVVRGDPLVSAYDDAHPLWYDFWDRPTTTNPIGRIQCRQPGWIVGAVGFD